MNDGWRVPDNKQDVTGNTMDPDDLVIDQRLDNAIGRLESISRGNRTVTKKRFGSAMSDKQIARAAVEGRKLIFRTGVLIPLGGYVVGMDNYHWLIAAPSEGDTSVQTSLIHKSCPLVTFTSEYLSGEISEDRKEIQRIGSPFWRYCIDNGLSRPTQID